MGAASPLSLQDQLRANDEAFANTGHVFGLDKLTRKASDPGTYLSTVAVLAAVVLAASYLPARHAVKIDPIAALRHH